MGVFDLGSMKDHERVRQLADAIVAGESEPCSPRDVNAPIDARIAAHLASSKQTVRALQWDGNVAVVFAMWGERRRLRPRSDANSTGENALHVKLDQLTWLFQGTPIGWRVYPVDDGDPD
ncbi:MAG: glycosyltransferase, partial [Acidimicrobiia bacterium]|nr:glycosyltransferase [Acidimicrobiia bacterium]